MRRNVSITRRVKTLSGMAGRVLSSNLFDLGRPYKLTFALTSRCQLKCTMCNIWQKQPNNELTADEIAAFFNRTRRISWINLSGGEIFLRPDILDIVRAIDRYSEHVYLLNFPTNGFETDRVVSTMEEILGGCGFPRLLVTVSLDGPPEVHDRIRRTPGAWERAVETYRRLREMQVPGFGVYFGMTLQRANISAFDETFHAVRDLVPGIGYRDIHVNMAHFSGHYYENEGCVFMPEADALLGGLAVIRRLRGSSLSDPVSLLERRFQSLAARYVSTGRTPLPCQALSASCFIDPAGTVYPCSSFGEPVGNIRNFGYDLDRLWRSERRLALRQAVREGKCPQCWTPCEAYQTILANVVPGRKRRCDDPQGL